MANIVENHISTYHQTFGRPSPSNVISTTEDGPLGVDTQPNHLIARPIREKLHYHSKASAQIAIPSVPFHHLVDKIYLGRAIDRCRWKDDDCAFKRIEFDCDVEGIEREIKTRETLLQALDLPFEAANKIMEERFCVLPMLAVVVDGNNDVVGILMPFGGPSLESLAESASEMTSAVPVPAVSASTELGVTVEQLRDLVRGVRELARVGVVHGDINDRNTLLKPPLDHKASAMITTTATAAAAHYEQNRLVLIDFGDLAPEYKNDAFALGELLLWCMVRCSGWDAEERRKVGDMAGVLKESGDFEKALWGLDDGERGGASMI